MKRLCGYRRGVSISCRSQELIQLLGKDLMSLRGKVDSVIEHFDPPPAGIGKTDLQFFRQFCTKPLTRR